ncbi:ABC transporter ATP-binding protein [Chelatococcus reniformis]|uniref:Branched-chain amino acid ABC transporter ATP-binding protein n=1 Tax=Chelatococcus reniformis TaxID=1494448 RepID=A0A916XGV9_9HYPH|nr:ATP-binding cassette domain-containing protein [Chelatococcus reniformis]GGC72572.1 branched-chain amino acid ABC transporter ATP-binding protein [Chelatococcus reniformis]
MLEVAHLDAFYGDGQILHAIALDAAEGERVAVLGRNGAGKSTLLKSLMNAGPRVAGAIRFDGRLLAEMPSYRRAQLGLALVPEDRRIYSHLTVLENIAIARYGAAGRKAMEPRQILERFSMLKPLEERYGGQLSGGQQQLLAVGRAFAAGPRLLLLDEPTEGLAPVIVEQMAREIAAICDEEKVGLVLCEQNIWFARACTSRLYLIDTGRIVFSGGWDEFDRNADLKQRYLAV